MRVKGASPAWSCPERQVTDCWRCSELAWFHRRGRRPHLNTATQPVLKLRKRPAFLTANPNTCVTVPVKPQASANKKVLQDMRKNRAVSSRGKSLSLVNLVTWGPAKVKAQTPRKQEGLEGSDKQVRGYESCHDSSGHAKSEGPAEDAQEDTEGLEQGHGLEAVAVVSCGLVRHDGAAARRGKKRSVRKRKSIFGKRKCKQT